MLAIIRFLHDIALDLTEELLLPSLIWGARLVALLTFISIPTIIDYLSQTYFGWPPLP